MSIIWQYAITWSVCDFGLCVEHFLLAMKYRRMSIEQPAKLDNLPEVKPTRCEHAMYYILLFLNGFFPILETFTLAQTNKDYYFFSSDPSGLLEIAANTTAAMIGLLQILSGIILLYSLFSIRRFFKDRDAIDSIDVRALLRHAAAFGLYLLATVVDSSALTLVVSIPSDTTLQIYIIAEVFWALMLFVSQVLLGIIFWNLSTEDELSSVIIEEFDEDAELQADMWNLLIRRDVRDNANNTHEF